MKLELKYLKDHWKESSKHKMDDMMQRAYDLGINKGRNQEKERVKSILKQREYKQIGNVPDSEEHIYLKVYEDFMEKIGN